LKFEKIVIGSSLSALAYAYLNNCTVFFTKPELPFRFGYLGVGEQPLDTPIDTKTLKTFDRTMDVGTPKQILWDRLYFVLSLNGQIPLSNLCHTLRYDGQSLVCSNEYSKIFEAEFERCYYFGDNNAEGIIRKNTLDEDTYLCYDHIAFNSGGKHELDFIHTGDDFISEIWFYSSDRIDGNTPVRDACAVSKLTESQLLDFDYSETMARFKVLKIMKDNGMRGKLSGYTKKGTARHYDFRTTSIRRETHCIRNRLRATSANVEIKTNSEESLLGLLQDANSPSCRLLDILDVSSP